MICPTCGWPLCGDGYTSVLHCINTREDMSDKECDSGPWYCTEGDLDWYDAVETYYNVYKSKHNTYPRRVDFDSMTSVEIYEAIKTI